MNGKVVTPHSGIRLHLFRDGWWLFAIAAVVAGSFLVWVAAGISGLLNHGELASVSWSQAGQALVRLPADPLNPGDAFPPGAGVGYALIFYPVLLATAFGTAVVGRKVWRRWSAWNFEGTDGLATRRELEAALGESYALSRLPALRPSLAKLAKVAGPSTAARSLLPARLRKEDKNLSVARPSVKTVAVHIGVSDPTGVPLWVPIEETILLIAPPREGKTSQIIMPGILDFEGTVLATSSKVDILYATAKLRERHGPVQVLDPTALSGWPHQLRWSLVDGCEDFTTARKRAETLTSTTKSEEGTKNGGYFAMNAQILITCWLHAAALEGLGAMNLLRWATAPSIREPVDILARHGRSDLARALAAQHAAAPEERSASWRTAEQSFTALYDPLVAQIFAADPKDPTLFSIEHWLRTGGTLFLIGEEDEGSSLAPIMAAFTRSILDTAKKVAAKMPNGRLDPPLGFFGDELANVAPLPQIPSLMSVSGSQNIFVVAVLQNLAQAQERWGEIGVRKMFAAATVKVILGGVSDEQELKTYSALAGEFEEDTESISDSGDSMSVSVSTRRRAVLEPADIRMIPERHGLVVHRRTKVTRVKFERIHESSRAAEIKAATDAALREAQNSG